MADVSRCFFIAGAVPFVLLGILHAFATPRTPAQSRGLSPRDGALREAMTRETLLLTRRTTLWLTWVGFNLSHSLGAVLFGSVVLLVGRSRASFQTQAAVFLPFVILVCAIYLWVAIRYWFRTPIVGIAFAGLCFITSSVLFVLGH